ncbi:MAG: subtype A tannase [Methanobrevibacter sp.]|uniref:subtype A tannase n=1 Tax=uncultured Methanobrevibacter sp. TaxID=253161 RepID=UPI0025D0D543|nr:subtype A tannase [uncultured Methanobrevibacter sp.]MEE1129143.1 subtype A tannase [Methanobrevibacter sp.]
MKINYIIIAVVILICIAGLFTLFEKNASSSEGPSYNASALTEKLEINMNNWNYDKTNDIYYQIGLIYCMNPEDTKYESCGIYVPGKYFDGTKNTNGTYTCKLNENNKVGNYSAKSAPIVMPVNTPGYSSCKAPVSYNAKKVKNYTDAGFVYLNAGCRGRDNAEAPDGVTDLKSAVTYYRFNGDVLPGDNEKIFTFGHSGGGAQSALMGASGNSELYNKYLESIGAAMVSKDGNTLSNAIAGSMCWCPITNLDTADEAYEWNMGQYMRPNGTFTSELSKDMATEYAKYINKLGLKDPNGNTLTLKESDSGVYAAGSYYDYMLIVTEESLNNFLNDTTFPYTQSQGEMDENSSEGAPSGEVPTGNTKSAESKSTTYKTAKDYIDSLNSNDTWIEYDSKTNTAKIKSLEAFVKHCKSPSKPVTAFDNLNRSQAENKLFGIDGNSSSHFNPTTASLLKNNSKKYSKFSDFSSQFATEYVNDLTKKDSQNNSMQTRVNMYNPMYYLCDYYNGSGTSDVAKYWRINIGIEQGHTSQCVDVNLYLAVLNKVGKDNVEFSTVWEQGHEQAERTGDSTTNFINWVNKCSN